MFPTSFGKQNEYIEENKMKKLLLLLSIILIIGCEDKKEDAILEANAVLRWTGDFAVDGCGFFIDIEDHEYKPEAEASINDSLKIFGSVEVFIRYELLKEKIEYFCGDWPDSFEKDGIILHFISKL